MKQIHTIVWKEDNLYVAKALEVEVASQGETEEQALENLQEALELYFEDNSNIEFSSGTFQSILRQAETTRKDLEKFIK